MRSNAQEELLAEVDFALWDKIKGLFGGKKPENATEGAPPAAAPPAGAAPAGASTTPAPTGTSPTPAPATKA